MKSTTYECLFKIPIPFSSRRYSSSDRWWKRSSVCAARQRGRWLNSLISQVWIVSHQGYFGHHGVGSMCLLTDRGSCVGRYVWLTREVCRPHNINGWVAPSLPPFLVLMHWSWVHCHHMLPRQCPLSCNHATNPRRRGQLSTWVRGIKTDLEARASHAAKSLLPGLTPTTRGSV